VKILTSWSQRIVPMLPQQSVQPKNKEAYTAAPLHPPKHGEESSNPCIDGNKFYAVSASVVTRQNHIPEKGAGESWGQRRCWSGLKVVVNHSKPTRHTPMHQDTTSAGGGAADVGRLAGQISGPARSIVSSIATLWR
jgi:hypothetical protein